MSCRSVALRNVVWTTALLLGSGSVLAEGAPRSVAEVVRSVPGERPFVLVPVVNVGPLEDRLEICDGDTCIRSWNLAWGVGKADWHAPLDLSDWAGRSLVFKVRARTAERAENALAGLRFAAGPEYPADLRDEPQRAQLHLTPTLGWTNDPNGLSYYNGEYHVFFQHNPCNRAWQNMTWGHFVSPDLVHWTDVGDVLHPDRLGSMFSGSAVVDVDGTAGFGKSAHVLAYTAAGSPSVQCLAYSHDGRRYAKFGANPVLPCVKPGNRDPRVFWHAGTKQWVLCLYVGDVEKYGSRWHTIHLYNSPDLKTWKLTDVVYGDKMHYLPDGQMNPYSGTYLYECPELVELSVCGLNEKRWVLFGASGEYAVGSFDGSKFRAERTGVKPPWGRRLSNKRVFYAAQAFTGDPKGRTVLLPWMMLDTDTHMNFNQGFGLPMSLSLKWTDDGIRLAVSPVEELEMLRVGDSVPFEKFRGELAEAFFEAQVGPDAVVTLDLRGEKVVYDALKGTLAVTSSTLRRPPVVYGWRAPGGRLSLRLFVDRFGLEVLSDDGLQHAPVGDFWPSVQNLSLSFSTVGSVRNVRARAYRLKSIWR